MQLIDGHLIVGLHSLLKVKEFDEVEVKKILKNFECPINKDVENFLHEKAIQFEKQGVSRTHLVMASYKGKMEIAGYYALAHKSFVVRHNKISSKLRSRIGKFGLYDPSLKQSTIVAPLIGQIGKNFKFKDLITGDVLLKYACDTVREAQLLIAGKIAYLECSDNPKLINFYEENGFYAFANRQLDEDEKADLSGSLVQMLRYFDE